MDALFPPGPQKSLLLGNATQFQHDPLHFMQESARAYGDIVHFRFGPSHAYLLANPSHAHYVLVERPDRYVETPSLSRALNSAFGHELFAPDERRARPSRVSPLFQPAWLDDFVPQMTALAGEMMTAWPALDNRNLVTDLMQLTLRVVARVVFDTTALDLVSRLDADAPFCRQFADRRFQSPLTLPSWVPTPDNRRRQQAVAELDRIIEGLVNEHRAPGAAKHSLLARLLEVAGARAFPSAYVQVRDEALALFLAGHETTAHSVAWALYLLAQHPDEMARLHEEVDRVLGNRLPTAEDLEVLPFTEMVMKETLRLYPPAWIISRQAKAETQLGDYYLPAGSTVFISPYILHRSRRYFVDPDNFLPERFAEGAERRLNRYAYAPFGGGPRAAVEGPFAMLQARLILAMLAQQFCVELEPGQTVVPEPHLTLRPKGGLKVRLLRRLAPVGV